MVDNARLRGVWRAFARFSTLWQNKMTGLLQPTSHNLHQFVAEIPVPMPIFISGRSAQNCVMAKRPRAIAGLGAAPQRKDNGWSWDLTPKTKNGQRMFFGHQPDQLSKVSDPVNPYGWMINPAIAESSTAKGGLFHRISGNVPSLRDRRLCRVWIIGIWLFQAVSMDCLWKIQALPTLSDFRGIRITGQSSDEAEAVGFRVDFFREYSVAYRGRAFLSHFKIMFHIKKSLARVCLHLFYQLFGDVNPNICSSFKTIIPFLSFPMFEHQKDTGNRQLHLADFG